jgi:putative addiction module component (TIGR02574 family)
MLYFLGMSANVKKLLNDALTLSESDRALLAASIINSIDSGDDLEVEAAWETEILKRLADIDSGAVTLLSWSDARKKITESTG